MLQNFYFLCKLTDSRSLSLEIVDLATMYKLKTHCSSHFVFQLINSKYPLILKTTSNESGWKKKFFFMRSYHWNGFPQVGFIFIVIITDILFRICSSIPWGFTPFSHFMKLKGNSSMRILNLALQPRLQLHTCQVRIFLYILHVSVEQINKQI